MLPYIDDEPDTRRRPSTGHVTCDPPGHRRSTADPSRFTINRENKFDVDKDVEFTGSKRL